MDPMTIGQLVGAGTSILGGLFSNENASNAHEQNLENMRMQYIYQKALQEQQQQWETNMSNTAHQRELADLKKAGLNPLLTAVGGAGATTPSSGMGSITGIQDGELQMQKQQIGLATAQTALNALQTRSNVALQEKQALQAQATAENQQSSTSLNNNLALESISRKALNDKDLKYRDRYLLTQIHTMASQGLNLDASTNKMKAELGAIGAEIENYKARNGLLEEQIKGQRITNKGNILSNIEKTYNDAGPKFWQIPNPLYGYRQYLKRSSYGKALEDYGY